MDSGRDGVGTGKAGSRSAAQVELLNYGIYGRRTFGRVLKSCLQSRFVSGHVFVIPERMQCYHRMSA